MLAALALAALVQLAQATTTSPPQSTLRGTVIDAKTAAPIADVRVSLSDLSRETKTGPDGRFEFADVAAGAHTLTASTIHYAFVRRRVEIAVNAVVEITVPLAEGTGTYTETVTVVSATKPMSELGVASQSELGSAALQDLRGVLADDPMRAMQALPGAATTDDFQSQFSVRGSAFRHVGIVTDDIVTPLLLHQVRGESDTGSIAMINSDVISRASLQSGPHPRRHGDWIGATMAFELREGSRERVTVRAAVSGTSASTVIEGPLGRTKRGSWLMSIRKSYIDWLIRKLAPSINSTIGFSDLQSKIVYDLTSRQQLQVVLIGGIGQLRQVTTGAVNGLSVARSQTGLAAVTWRYARPAFVITQRVSVLASEFQNLGLRQQDLGRGVSRSLVWRGDVLKPLGTAWTIDGGGRVESDHSTQRLTQFRSTAGTLSIRAQQSVGATDRLTSVWGQLARRTAVSGVAMGVRVSTASIGPWHTVSPWLLAERAFGAFTLRGGAGAASQIPDVVMIQAAAVAPLTPKPPMAPEHVRSFDAGIEHRVNKTLRWLVTGFYRADSHILRAVGEARAAGTTFIAATPFPQFAAELNGTSRGADVVFERRASRGPIGWVGYTWAHTRYRDTVTGETFDGDFDQRHTMNAFVQQRLSYRWSFNAKLRIGSNFPLVGYYSGAPASPSFSALRNQVRLPTYARLDLRVDRTFTFDKRRLTLFIEVMNVTGRRNLSQAEGFAAPTIPRVPSAGFLIEF